MSHFKNKRPIIHFYTKVGTPELVFFLALLTLFFIPFVFETNDGIFESILLTSFVFSIQYLIKSYKSKYYKYLTAFLIFSLILYWLKHLNFSVPPIIENITEIIIMLISFYFVYKSIFKSNEVDINTLIAAISGYLLLGIIWGIIIFIMQSMNPIHFNFGNNFTAYDTYYYSFVTMSTLGYGDVLPLSTSAKGFAILITLNGQFYMVIVMGVIIGKLLSKSEKKNE